MRLTKGEFFRSFNPIMKQLLISIFVVLAGVLPALSQTSTPAVQTVNDYRPLGETRTWKFIRDDSLLGSLSSRMMGTKDIEGQQALIIRQRLRVDVGPPGDLRLLEVSGEHYVAPNGGYLGDRRDKLMKGKPERVDIVRRGDSLVGAHTLDSRSRGISYYFDFADPAFAFDQLYLDELEMFFAMHDLTVGDTITEDVFIVPVITKGKFRAVVESTQRAIRPNGASDSVFVINIERPRRIKIHFTPDKRLVWANWPGQQLVAYLDVVDNRVTSPPTEIGFSLGRVKRLLPPYVLYVLFGALSLVMFVGHGYRSSRTYLAVVVGALGFMFVPWTQTPLQVFLFERLLLPRISAGGSPYFWSLFPALAAGVIQESLKLGLLALALALFKPGRGQYLVLGAAVGVGLGIVEACHQAAFAQGELLGQNLLEHGFTILFHAVAGALLGWSLCQGWRSERWILTLLGVIAINSFLRYMPIFVQQKAIALDAMYLLIPLTVIITLFLTIVIFKRSERT